MKRVIVTGGLGFIGSHLVEMLLDRGMQVVVVDSKISNAVEENHFEGKDCQVIVDEVANVDFESLGEFDLFFHLASILGPSGVLRYPGVLGWTIVSDIKKILEYCDKHNTRLLDISTSEVYGRTGRLDESSDKVLSGPYGIRNEYGIGKMLSEIMICNKAEFSNFNYSIIRPFNVSGPRQKPDGGFVLPRFIIAALTDQPITVFGDGTAERAFTNVLDICEGILRILDSEYVNQIWNIGNPDNRRTIDQLADLVIERVKARYPDRKCDKVYIDPRDIHGRYFCNVPDKLPYIEKIESFLGWRPTISVEETIERLIDFYDAKVKAGYTFEVMK